MSPPASASAPAASPAYGLTPPTEVDFHVGLRRQLGVRAADDAWERACRACAVPVRGLAPTSAELECIAEHLTQQPGVTGVVGRSMLIRLRAYALLARRAASVAASAATDQTTLSAMNAP